MSLPPADQPFIDDEDDLKRKAEIEEMMRWQRESYFRNEPVQQEYRDVVTRLAGVEEARSEGTATDFRGPGPFDVALERFMEKKRSTESVNANPPVNPRLQVASLGRPFGIDMPDDDVGDTSDRFGPDAMVNRAAKATGFNRAKSGDEPSESQQPYRVAQAGTYAKRPIAEIVTPAASTPGDINQPVHKISDPLTMALEWHYDFKKYAEEVEQFTKSKGIAGTIIFEGKPRNTDQPANNAFAHAGLSALYAYDRGIDDAKTVGDGREKKNYLEDKVSQALRRLKNIVTSHGEDLPGDEKERSLKLDSYKDLFNNSIGRQIGVAAKAAGLSRDEVLNLVHEALKVGKLITDEYVDPRVDRNFDGNPDNYRPPSGTAR